MAYVKRGFANGEVLDASHLIAMEEGIIAVEHKVDNSVPSIGEDGNWYLGSINTGVRAVGVQGNTGMKGDKGDPFTVAKTYPSIDEMNADFGNADIAEGSFVIISSDTDDEANAQLYVKGATAYTFITDMSGVTGIKGDPGVGISGIERTDGDGTSGTTDTYTITKSDGSTATFTVYNGKDGDESSGGQAEIMVNGLLKGDGTGNVVAAIPGVDYAMPGAGSLTPVIDVLVATGADVTCTDGITTLTAVSVDNHCVFILPKFARWIVTATYDGNTVSKVFTVDTVRLYKLSLWVRNIYGVSWDGTTSSAWTRTDKSVDIQRGYGEPMAYVSNASGFSPYDEIYPWSEVHRVSDPVAGELVSIPKFWFKWTDNGVQGLQLQIADYPAEGFHVSPAHADRGDGQGERDVVYIGRYLCNANFTSATSYTPIASKSLDAMREGINSLGDEYHLQDLQMHYTLLMLYLVEYADWNAQQNTIGAGRSNSVAVGISDTAQYHTGCMLASRYTSSSANNVIQYRYVEDFYGYYYEFLDGNYVNNGQVYLANNPADYPIVSADNTFVGQAVTTSGVTTQFQVSTAEGFEWFIYAIANTGGLNSRGVSDAWVGNDNEGHYSLGNTSTLSRGVISINMTSGTSSSQTSARLMKLPNNT